MWDKLQNETLPAGYTKIKLTPPDNVISIITEELKIETGLPVIKLNLTIYIDLHVKMHVCNTEIPSSKASKLTNKSGICGSTTEVLAILALLKTLTVDRKTAMNYAAELLDTTNVEFSSYQQSQFIPEQLRLSPLPSHGRRYSSSLMSIALVWFRTSPKLYEDLYHSNLLILPHVSTLRRFTSVPTSSKVLILQQLNI